MQPGTTCPSCTASGRGASGGCDGGATRVSSVGFAHDVGRLATTLRGFDRGCAEAASWESSCRVPIALGRPSLASRTEVATTSSDGLPDSRTSVASRTHASRTEAAFSTWSWWPRFDASGACGNPSNRSWTAAQEIRLERESWGLNRCRASTDHRSSTHVDMSRRRTW